MIRRALTALALAACLPLAACGSGDDDQAAATTSATAVTLPDGRTATDAEAAYLSQIKPSMSDDHNRDVVALLENGHSVCEVNMSEDWTIDALQKTSDGYDRTEATAIDTAARHHLCES